MNELFSMRGRLNRAKYFWRTLVIGLVTYIFAFMGGLVTAEIPPMFAGARVLGFIILLGGIVIMAFQVVKRLHDIERPGTHYWLLLIPFYNIYLGLVLLFKKGTDGPNQYGDDPLAKR